MRALPCKDGIQGTAALPLGIEGKTGAEEWKKEQRNVQQMVTKQQKKRWRKENSAIHVVQAVLERVWVPRERSHQWKVKMSSRISHH